MQNFFAGRSDYCQCQKGTLLGIDLCASVCVGVVMRNNCEQLMMEKFGRLVDLDALQTLSGDRRLEELKQEKLIREAAYAKEIKQWNVR